MSRIFLIFMNLTRKFLDSNDKCVFDMVKNKKIQAIRKRDVAATMKHWLIPFFMLGSGYSMSWYPSIGLNTNQQFQIGTKSLSATAPLHGACIRVLV